MLRGIDRAALVTALSVHLRDAGLPVGFANLESFARALACCPPDSRSRLYWVARISLVRERADLETFDGVFAAVFDDTVLGLDPQARRDRLTQEPAAGEESHSCVPVTDGADGAGLPWRTRPQVVGASNPDESEVGVPELMPSDLEGLADVPFEDLDSADIALLSGWLQAALHEWPTRRSRRLVLHPSGRRIAIRATLAGARRTGWESFELAHSWPTRRLRRVVMLCDVSQSMQAYSTAYLHLLRAAVLSTDAEVFAFATSLTRLTPVIAHRSPAVAIELASARVNDRFGGTRIAANIRTLLASRHGGTTRGAIVIIASDGWDSDPPHELAIAMAKLRRRSYRILWMNPRAAFPGFQPLVGAMAAALPFCDELLPAHNIRALGDVIAAIACAGGRR